MGLHIYRAEEEQLIEGCRRRNNSAQRRVYDLYSSRMYALCQRYMRNSADSEDVLISAFMKVFDRIDQYKGEGSFEGWIRRIVVNEALTALRRNRNMALETDIEAADWDSQALQTVDHLHAQDLADMIAELPPGYRVVFNMYAIDGYSHKEIAEQLGISENTSKSQLSRARAYLRKLLESYEVPHVQNGGQ